MLISSYHPSLCYAISFFLFLSHHVFTNKRYNVPTASLGVPSIILSFSASAQQTAHTIRTIANQVYEESFHPDSWLHRDRWLQEPPTENEQFLLQLGMFHPLSAHQVLEVCGGSLATLLQMSWAEMVESLCGWMPMRAYKRWYQYITALKGPL